MIIPGPPKNCLNCKWANTPYWEAPCDSCALAGRGSWEEPRTYTTTATDRLYRAKDTVNWFAGAFLYRDPNEVQLIARGE